MSGWKTESRRSTSWVSQALVSRSTARRTSSSALMREQSASSERVSQAFHAPVEERHHIEARLEPRAFRVRGEPGLGGAAQAALLLRGHHLEWVAVPPAAFGLDLDEREPPPPPHDQVELVPAAPDVRLHDPVAAQPVEPPRPPLGGAAGGAGATCNRARCMIVGQSQRDQP